MPTGDRVPPAWAEVDAVSWPATMVMPPLGLVAGMGAVRVVAATGPLLPLAVLCCTLVVIDLSVVMLLDPWTSGGAGVYRAAIALTLSMAGAIL
ncbi:hypothetical protein [Pseudonocardia sp. H11422]|uniref:hypothetical protein n=1 Tax=Pseudonocardia sp. H11422 TaxID=2835866 RepID=UPI001BDC1C42|nr:hypothetical protein [Pseudonocardia sp. H11422]